MTLTSRRITSGKHIFLVFVEMKANNELSQPRPVTMTSLKVTVDPLVFPGRTPLRKSTQKALLSEQRMFIWPKLSLVIPNEANAGSRDCYTTTYVQLTCEVCTDLLTCVNCQT